MSLIRRAKIRWINPDFLIQLLTLFFFFYLLCVFVFVCQGLASPLGKPVCSFDPEGLIFAAGVESQAIKLYDLRAFDKVKCKLVFCVSTLVCIHLLYFFYVILC